ncbi:MAG: hypothetical protein GF372_13440 [Candidatus Marinimicrobia bacterium]|nr:hypothetical protein [Candidatus Neomarinimicrobiota bacterium]
MQKMRHIFLFRSRSSQDRSRTMLRMRPIAVSHAKAILFFLSLILLFTVHPEAFSQERSRLWPSYKDTPAGKLYGYAYTSSMRTFIIEPQYAEAGAFSTGENRIAPVKNHNNEWGYINEQNEVVIPFTDAYQYATGFVNGYAVVWNNEKKMGLINRNGEITVDMQYVTLGEHYNGLLPAQNADGKYGYINPTGDVTIPFIFEKAANFAHQDYGAYEGKFAQVTINGMVTLVNEKGQYLTYPENLSDPRFRVWGDLALVSYYNDDYYKYFYSIIKPDGTQLFKNSDAMLEISNYSWDLNNTDLFIIMREESMRLNSIRTSDPYDYGYFMIRWEGNVSPTDLVVPVVSVYEQTGKEIISREAGYNFFDAGKEYCRVGRAFSMEGKAAARFGFVNWKGEEVLKTLYYETAWNEEMNMGIIGIDKLIRIGMYLDYINAEQSESQAEALYRNYSGQSLSSEILYLVDEDLNCVTRSIGDLSDTPLPKYIEWPGKVEKDSVLDCSHVPDLSFENYDQLKTRDRVFINDHPQYVELPFTLTQPTKQPVVTEMGTFEALAEQKQNFTYNKEGLPVPGTVIDTQFRYIMSREGHIMGFNSEGKASPRYFNLAKDPKSNLPTFYSWFEGLQHSINIGMFIQYEKPDGNMTYSMTDWHNNDIIQPDVKYMLHWYMNNGLLWLKEIKNRDKDYVLNTENMLLTDIPVNEELLAIYQTRDNSLLFPLTKNGLLYKASISDGELVKIAENIDWAFVFENREQTCLMVRDMHTNNFGVIDSEGNGIMPLEYNNIQTNLVSDNPNLFAGKDGQLIGYNIESGQSQVLKENVSFTAGYRRAFGKYGVYQDGESFLLFDNGGAEVLRIKAETVYGQPGDFSMMQQNGRWAFFDETGANPFDRDFVDIYPFHDGLSLVVLDGEYNAFINKSGEFVIGPFPIYK